jgi:hypothetical protein
VELLARRGGPVDTERGRRRATLGPSPAIDDLVACLVVPYASLVADEGGRAYLQIVVQLRGRFAAWRVESDAASTKHLAEILDEIEAGSTGTAAVRRARIVAMIMLLTAATAERARAVDDDAPHELDHAAFEANLVAMCAAVLTA